MLPDADKIHPDLIRQDGLFEEVADDLCGVQWFAVRIIGDVAEGIETKFYGFAHAAVLPRMRPRFHCPGTASVLWRSPTRAYNQTGAERAGAAAREIRLAPAKIDISVSTIDGCLAILMVVDGVKAMRIDRHHSGVAAGIPAER